MARFSTPTHIGVMESFIALGIIYFCFMMVGSIIGMVHAIERGEWTGTLTVDALGNFVSMS